MSKRQLRISDPEQIKTKIFTFANRNMSVVLKNNTVVFGKLKEVDNDSIYIENMRLKKYEIPLNNIAEFILDVNA